MHALLVGEKIIDFISDMWTQKVWITVKVRARTMKFYNFCEFVVSEKTNVFALVVLTVDVTSKKVF